ncbi:MAG: T9SS type A sorting domain-containing protein [Bacteroidota bacterium]
MKSITLALAMCLCLALFAQDRDTTTWYQHLQFKTALLHNEQILTGRLYDRVPEGLSPHKYKGQYVDTLNTLQNGDFKQLFWQHCLSRISKEVTPEERYQQYDSLNWHYIKEGSIPINVLGYAYDIIRDDAIENGLLSINADSQLVHSSTTSPFTQFTLFASSLWYHQITENNNTVSFILPSDLFVSNITTPIQSIEFKTGNGNFFPIQQGMPFTVNFEDTGYKTCVVHITYQSGAVLESGFSFYLKKKAEVLLPDLFPTAIASIPFYQVCKAEPNYNPYGVARYYIKYANPDKQLRRPFIFVEGIDFDYRDYLDNPNNTNFPPALRYGEFGWDVFVSGGSYPQSIPDHSSGAPFSIGLTELAGQQGLIQQLLNEGYDIVLVDFSKGADYVQKNAFALVKVIQELNNSKITKEDNVIVGASMGGLTTRYALAYMEKNNLKHCTRLWCSFDSPHLGANIPIGLQYALLFFANSDNTARENIRRLNLPAAKQMLIRHVSRSYDGTKEIETYASCFRQNLVTALTEIGWPNQLRKIALTNGNVSGLGNGISNGAALMEWSHSETPKVLGVPVITFQAAACNIFAQGRNDHMVFYGLITKPNPKLYISGICVGTGGVKTIVIPNGPIMITGALPGLGPCYTLQIDRFGKQEKWNCGGASCPNLDGAPGGLHDGIKTMYDGIKKTAVDNKLTLPNPSYTGLVTFIPSISSVNVYNEKDYFFNIRNAISMDFGELSKTPFESYKGPELHWPNEGHVFLTKNNQWGIGYQGNKEDMTKQLALNYNDPIPNIPNTIGSVYNHGLPALGALKTKSINAGGSYCINKQGLVGWRVSGNPISVASSTLTVRTVNNCDGYAMVTVNSGGQLIVGDIGPVPTNNKGIVTFESGSSLVLNSGSVFIIHKGSKVIIEEGASLYVNQGCNIQIAETGILEVRGKLFIGNNAVLSINEVPMQGKGFIKFVNNEHLSSSSYQINPGMNSKISLTGIVSGATSSKILEISGSGGLFLQQHIRAFNFEVINGTIELGANNFIKSTSNIKLQNVIVKPSGTGNPIGIMLDEDHFASAPITPIISINQTKFYQCNKGLSITRSLAAATLSLSNNQFYNCASGLHTSGIIMNVSQTSFFGCNKGWEIENPIGTNIGTELSSNGCDIGVSHSTGNPATLSLTKFNSIDDAIGIATSGGTLKVKCMYALNSQTAAIYSNNTHVILNGTDAGFNRFLNSENIGVILNTQSGISMKDGNNYFSQSPVNSNYAALSESDHSRANVRCSQGTFSPDPTGFHMEAIDISGNYLGGSPAIGYKRLCGTIYQNGALYNDNVSSSTFIATQIDNTCNQSSGQGGGYGKRGSDPESQQGNEPMSPATENTFESISVYPNPVQDELTIELNHPEGKQISLYDSYGRRVYYAIAKDIIHKLNTSTFKSGVYLLHITGQTTDKRIKIMVTK